MVCNLAVPVSAGSAEVVPELKVTASVKEIEQGTGTADVIYTITLDPHGKEVAAFQFKLKEPEGMTLAKNKLPAAETNQGGDGYWIATKALKYKEDEDTGAKTGYFTIFEYTASTGCFGASGTSPENRITTEAVIMTIKATVDISTAKTYLLGVTEFISAPNGEAGYPVADPIVDSVVVKAKAAAKLASIAVTKKPSKLEYEVGESFDTTGMEVTATYSDSRTKVVTDYTTDAPATFTSAGTNKITIKYTEGGETRQTTLGVTVKEKSPEALTGTVKINGKAVYGETLTAALEGGNNTGTLSYKWYRGEGA